MSDNQRSQSTVWKRFVSATDFVWMPVCPTFRYSRLAAWNNALDWQEKLCLLREIDPVKCGLDQVCEDGWRFRDEKLATMERKADWLLAILAGVLGLLLHERANWSLDCAGKAACLMTLPGLWLCLRARLPATYRPSPADAMTEMNLAESLEHDLSRATADLTVEDAHRTIRHSAMTSRALTQFGLKLVTDWKADCINAASKWLLFSAFAAVFAFA